MNKKINFNVIEKDKFSLVEFQLDGTALSPSDLRGIKLPNNIDHSKGVVLSGRGPIWLYGHLVHEFHPAKWVATHDPRLNGGVVVATHDPTVNMGDVIPLE